MLYGYNRAASQLSLSYLLYVVNCSHSKAYIQTFILKLRLMSDDHLTLYSPQMLLVNAGYM